MKTQVSILFTALTLIAGNTMANDSDKKGNDERRKKMEARFNQADTNKDGGLSLAEAKAAKMERVVNHFDKLDADKDGKVTKAEFAAVRKGPRK